MAARCSASDAQLMAQGAGACPDRSIVGGGRLHEGSTASGAYVRTPHSCPGSERWVSAFRFGYRDGVTQTVTSRTPCRHVRSRR